ncbi:hypothetical protein [Mangrovicoccus algicola]|uniref:Uncharacterized protein n=1 Tax=Mangrovicoccus algicola TaxID=2771008 RepID=A0A8J6YWU3_9RHOB|nr:hypothetical protein [Mangrovicoccus algicola]MBE3640638.1 hypothetical protein [Mangrovicoccus algicola]
MRHGLPEKLTCQGVQHDLSHLSPFVHTLPGQGPDGTDLAIRIRFESHVFSKSHDGGSPDPHDFLDENGNKRAFCQVRYNFSHCLADEVRRMLDINAMSMQVHDKRGFYNLAVITPAGQQITTGLHNTVIYYMHKSQLDGIHTEMRVKSCYEKHLRVDRRAKKDKIRTYAKRAYYEERRVPKPTGD